MTLKLLTHSYFSKMNWKMLSMLIKQNSNRERYLQIENPLNRLFWCLIKNL